MVISAGTGCGGGGPPGAGKESNKTVAVGRPAADKLLRERAGSSAKADATCTYGRVRLDSRSGSVSFTAACIGRGERKKVAIGLARRVPGHPGRSVGIVGFARFARVKIS